LVGEAAEATTRCGDAFLTEPFARTHGGIAGTHGEIASTCGCVKQGPRPMSMTTTDSDETREPEPDNADPLRQLAVELIRSIGGRCTVRDLTRRRFGGFRWAMTSAWLLQSMVDRKLGGWEAKPASAKGGRPSRVFVLNAVSDETA
jgi:hypothetical protein